MGRDKGIDTLSSVHVQSMSVDAVMYAIRCEHATSLLRLRATESGH